MECGLVLQARQTRPENACRDALLFALRRELRSLEINAEAEGRYANGARADVRLSVGGSMNIPIEINRSCHKEWFSAIRTQLIERYTHDPDAHGYGIYLVFWFGRTKYC
ncbi:MAG: hypothetical protein OXI38_02825 [Bacteroidota bacterium]|nr:hypothetical protein [Bacteroidota bacterium]